MNSEQAHEFVRKVKELRELCEESGLGSLTKIELEKPAALGVAMYKTFSWFSLSRVGERMMAQLNSPVVVLGTTVEQAPMEEERAQVSAG